MILYDEKLDRKEKVPVGSKLSGKRYTEVTLGWDDVARLLYNPEYLTSILEGFRPVDPQNPRPWGPRL